MQTDPVRISRRASRRFWKVIGEILGVLSSLRGAEATKQSILLRAARAAWIASLRSQ
jgi:hypothetical protein